MTEWTPGISNVSDEEFRVLPPAVSSFAVRLIQPRMAQVGRILRLLQRVVVDFVREFWNAWLERFMQPQPGHVDFTVSRYLTYLAFTVFMISLFVPAAMIIDEKLYEFEPTTYRVVPGFYFLLMSTLFCFIHTFVFLHCVMNMCLIFCMAAIFFKPAFFWLRCRFVVCSVAGLIAFSGWYTVERYAGWWLWNAAFWLVAIANLWPLMRAPEEAVADEIAVK